MKELNPEDLTTEQQAVLGELAREEAKEAAYFQEETDRSEQAAAAGFRRWQAGRAT